MLVLAAGVCARLAPTPEPVLGGRRIARVPHQLAPEALDFTRLIRAGDTVGWAEATAEPVFLTRLLDAQAARCASFRVFFPLALLAAGVRRGDRVALLVSNHMILVPPPRRIGEGEEHREIT